MPGRLAAEGPAGRLGRGLEVGVPWGGRRSTATARVKEDSATRFVGVRVMLGTRTCSHA